MKDMTAFQTKPSYEFVRSFARASSVVSGEGLGVAKGGGKESGTRMWTKARVKAWTERGPLRA